MAQYIDKSALVAEIERRIKVLQNHPKENHKTICHLDSLKQFLNTFEMKEVNFKKEFDNYAKDILACDVQFQPFTHLYNCAKYFYELGLTAQKRK